MADIFLSYSTEDRAFAARTAAVLESLGFTVWWDRNIHAGADFASEIGRELAAAGAALVLWSRASIASEWVRDEAGEARDAGKLVPACIDGSRPPIGFRQRQATDLSGWDGRADRPAFLELVASLHLVIGRPAESRHAEAIPEIAPRKLSIHATWVAAAVAVVAAVAIGAVALVGVGASRSGVSVESIRPLGEPSASFAQSLSAALLREFARAGIDAGSARPRSHLRITGSVGLQSGRFIVDFAAENDEGRVLWSQRFRQEIDDAAAFQELAAKRGAGAVVCALTKQDNEGLKLNANQFGALLAVCSGWESNDISGRYAAAVQFEKFAPSIALAHAELAAALGPLSMGSHSQPERLRLRDESRREAEKALAIDPENALANTVLGHALRNSGDIVGAMEHWEKGVQFAYEPGPFMTIEWQLREVGYLDGSLDAIERAIGRFPNNLYFLKAKAEVLGTKGDWIREEATLERLMTLDPSAVIQSFGVIIAGDLEIARARFEQLTSAGVSSGKWHDCFSAFLALRDGNGTAAREGDASLRGLCGENLAARMYAQLGDPDGAFAALDGLYSSDEWTPRTLLFTPEMVTVRSDPRFWRLAKRLDLLRFWTTKGRWPDFCASKEIPIDCKRLAAEAAASTQPTE